MSLTAGYQISKCKDMEVWNDFVSNSPQCSIFCKTNFIDTYGQNYDLLLVTKGELILLGVVIIKNNREGLARGLFTYQGVLFSKYIESLQPHKKNKKKLELTQFLLTELEFIYGVVTLSLHHSLIDLRGFQWHNYHNADGFHPKLHLRYTGILDLTQIKTFEQVLVNSRAVRRQEYKRCLKNGFTVEESNDIDTLDLLHRKTFERQNLIRSKSEVFIATKFAKESIDNGFGRLLICKNSEGKSVSASLFLFDHRTGYYLVGASDPDYRKNGVGSYVVFEQIRRCINQHLSFVDFMGINSPSRGDFKTSFNANPTAYFTYKTE
jgi:lipid II:glycine glycyltransferase (peptidoglycan interpeptide bridge formation enzyme)